LGNQLRKQIEPLGHQLDGEVAEAREVAARPGETGDETRLDRVVVASEDDRNRRSRIFRRQCRRIAGGCDYGNPAADEIGGQCGQPIIATLRPAIFDRHILSLDVPGFTQPSAEADHRRRSRVGRTADEEADHRHHLLLRAQRPRRGHSAAQQHQQLAAPHTITSLFVRGRHTCLS